MCTQSHRSENYGVDRQPQGEDAVR